MAVTTQRTAATVEPRKGGPPQVKQRDHLVLLLLSGWMVLGLVVDVWSHSWRKSESFFTPWHAMFYSGFMATVGWLVWPIVRGRRTGGSASDAIPIGTDLAIVGALIFAGGGVADMLWHTAFGFETGVEIMLSPPHILLVTGLALIASGPFRAAWAAHDADDEPSLRSFLPAVLSLAMTACVVGLVINHLWGFPNIDFMATGELQAIAAYLRTPDERLWMLREFTYQRGTSNILLTNLFLLAPILMMLRRWRIPFGSITVFLTVTTALMAVITGMTVHLMIPIAVAAGLVADWLAQTLRPSSQRVAYFRVFAATMPLALWGTYVAVIAHQRGLAWPVTVWLGAILWTSASGLLLSVVALPGRPRPAATAS